MKIGLQVPSFSFPDGTSETMFETLSDIAITAEANGFDTFMVMDHFFQLPFIGPMEEPMLECYTTLGAIAARTSSIKVSTLVTGVTYRNPAFLAKVVTALDVVSKGRAICAIGAAWFDAEHHALGYEFPPLKERFERLEDAINICRAMFDSKQSTYEGTHYKIVDAYNVPRPVQPRLPLLIGGQGEKKTFRMAAQYAEFLNMTASHADIPQKLSALQGHLDALGRARSDISVSTHSQMVVGRDNAELNDRLRRMLSSRGMDPDLASSPEKFRQMIGRGLIGTPEQIIEQARDLRSLGLDGLTVAIASGPYDLENVALAGETLKAAFAD